MMPAPKLTTKDRRGPEDQIWPIGRPASHGRPTSAGPRADRPRSRMPSASKSSSAQTGRPTAAPRSPAPARAISTAAPAAGSRTSPPPAAATADGSTPAFCSQFDQRRRQPVGLDGQPGDPADLADDDRDRDADEEPDQDRARQQARQIAQPQHAAEQADHADAKRDQRGHRRPVGGRRRRDMPPAPCR